MGAWSVSFILHTIVASLGNFLTAPPPQDELETAEIEYATVCFGILLFCLKMELQYMVS